MTKKHLRKRNKREKQIRKKINVTRNNLSRKQKLLSNLTEEQLDTLTLLQGGFNEEEE